MIQFLAPRRPSRTAWWLRASLLLLATFSLVLSAGAPGFASEGPAGSATALSDQELAQEQEAERLAAEQAEAERLAAEAAARELVAEPVTTSAAGNDGFIQLNGQRLPGEPSNEPHLGCAFDLEFFGFDPGPNSVVVQIVSQSPTGPSRVPVPTATGDLVFSFEGGSPPGNTANHLERYTLDLRGFRPQPVQGYHITFSVSVNGGNDLHKTVWVRGCEPTPPSPLSIEVEKLNDADLDGEFTDDETARTAGQAVDFTARITNTGAVAVEIVSITDAFEDVLYAACSDGADSLIGTVLEPRGSATCAFALSSYSPGPGESVENTVTVKVVEPGVPDNTDEASDTSIVRTPLPVPPLDLAVAKTDEGATAVRGGPLVYTLTVTNVGVAPIGAFTLTEQPQTGVTVTGIDGGADFDCSGLVCTYTGQTLQTGDFRQLAVTATVAVDAPDVVENVVVIDAPGDDNPANDRDDEQTPVDDTPVVDLGVTKTDNDVTAVRGGTITYTLQVSNVGNTTVEAFTVTEQPQTGITVTGIDGGADFDCTGLVCTYTGAPLQPGQARQLSVSASVAADAPSSVENVVVVDAPGDENPANDRDDETTPVPVRDLRIVKVDDVASSVRPGGTYGYTLTVTNDGGTAETGFAVSDPLPAELTLVGTPAAPGFSCTGLTCTYGEVLQPGQSVTLTFSVLLAETFDGETVVNSATVTLPPGDPTPENNTSTETTPVTRVLPNLIPPANVERPVDLRIDKTDSVDSVRPGQQLRYSLVVTNIGEPAAEGFVVTDALPSGLSLVSVSGAGFQCTGTTTVRCTHAGALLAGQRASLQLVTLVAADYSGDRVVNTAVVPLDGDPTPENNTSTENTPLVKVPPGPPAMPPSLPFTGGHAEALVTGALGLLLLGLAAQVLGRRGPASAARHAA